MRSSRAVRGAKPALIVNAGAYTAVDRAETERALAHAVNGRAPGVLAEEAKRIGAVLIHYSTDYVFDGKRTTPYAEDAPTAPLNVYGASKLEGERAIAAVGAHALVFRTSWVYGLRGRNFLLTIRRLAGERDELRIVADQIGVPNWCRTLAEATARVVAAGLPALAERAGLYHLSSSGHASWYDFARAIVGDRADAAGRADHDRRVSDAGAPAGVRRARDRPLRGDVRLRAARLARRARPLPREPGGPPRRSKSGTCSARLRRSRVRGRRRRRRSRSCRTRRQSSRGSLRYVASVASGSAPPDRGLLVGGRDLAARARLDELQRDAVRCDRVEMVFVVRLEPRDARRSVGSGSSAARPCRSRRGAR